MIVFKLQGENTREIGNDDVPIKVWSQASKEELVEDLAALYGPQRVDEVIEMALKFNGVIKGRYCTWKLEKQAWERVHGETKELFS